MLWQYPLICLRKPHTQNPTLDHMGSPWSKSTLPSHSRGDPEALHPGLALLMTIPTMLVKKRAWRVSSFPFLFQVCFEMLLKLISLSL